jgi:hypothetical protein
MCHSEGESGEDFPTPMMCELRAKEVRKSAKQLERGEEKTSILEKNVQEVKQLS